MNGFCEATASGPKLDGLGRSHLNCAIHPVNDGIKSPEAVKIARPGKYVTLETRSMFGEFLRQSAESAIEFGRRLQRHQIAGLKNMGSCSIPTAPTNISFVNCELQICEGA